MHRDWRADLGKRSQRALDPFGAGTGGRPGADVHWLFQLGLLLHQSGGLAGIMVMKTFLVGIGAILLLRISRAQQPAAHALAVPAVSLALLSVCHLLLARPVIATLVFLALFLLVLERFARRGKPRLLWALLPVQALWVNVQPLWPLGLFLVLASARAWTGSWLQRASPGPSYVGTGRTLWPLEARHTREQASTAPPGGTMKLVRDVIREKSLQELITVEPTAGILDAAELMTRWNVGAVLVMKDEELVGILSERDYVRRFAATGRPLEGLCVEDLMSTALRLVPGSLGTAECMALMTRLRMRHLPVVEGSHVLGVISLGDLVKEVVGEQAFVIEQLEAYITRAPNV